MNQSMTIGIDLAKRIFFVAALDRSGKPARRKKLRRHEVLPFLANHPGLSLAWRLAPARTTGPGRYAR